jgi:hypothetical protein
LIFTFQFWRAVVSNIQFYDVFVVFPFSFSIKAWQQRACLAALSTFCCHKRWVIGTLACIEEQVFGKANDKF